MMEPTTPPDQLADRDLVEDYDSTSGEPGDERADADLAEIERRELDL